MLTQDICNFYKALAVYDQYGGIVFGQQEGKNIAKALGTSNKVGGTSRQGGGVAHPAILTKDTDIKSN